MIEQLPTELVIQIFAYLDPESLDRVGLVCKTWYKLTQDNAVWARALEQRYPAAGTSFPSAARTTSWRKELLTRDARTAAWLSGRGIRRSYPLPCPYPAVPVLMADFQRDTLVAFEPNSERLTTCHANSGKGGDTVICATPAGTSAYNVGPHGVVYGGWDGSVQGSLIDHHNILLSGIQPFTGLGHQNMVTSVFIGRAPGFHAITGDGSGVVSGWDIKRRILIRTVKFTEALIVRLDTDGKNVVTLDNLGVVWLSQGFLRGAYKTKKLGQIPGLSDAHLLVDWGGHTVIVYDEHKLETVNFDGERKVLPLGTDTISQVVIDEGRQFIERDTTIVGGDALMIAVILRLGKVMVVDVRGSSYTMTPRFVIAPPNGTRAMITSASINAYVVLIGSFNGLVDMYDVLGGTFRRRVSGRLERRLLGGEASLPAMQIRADGNKAIGVIGYGPVVQYFQFGDQGDKKKAKAHGKDRKQSADDIRATLNDYEYEMDQRDQEEQLVERYNGDHGDQGDDIEMAVALSMSMDQSLSLERDPDESDMSDAEMEEALRLSREDADREMALQIAREEGYDV